MPLTAEQLQKIRETEFPVLQHYVPFNHAGVAPVCTRASVAAAHFAARAARIGPAEYDEWMKRLEKVRGLASWFVGAQPDEIAFVRNTSHGLSLVAQGLEWKPGDNVVTTDAEFPSNLFPWQHLKSEGVELRLVSAKERAPTLEDFSSKMDSRTRLLSISHVEFSTGCRFDLKALSDLAHSKGALFCVDAIQSLGVLPVNVERQGIDFLAADGHKWLCSFEGTGIFYCRKSLLPKLTPVLVGWNTVQKNHEFEKPELSFPDHARKFEEGSLPLVSIFALEKALELFAEVGIDEVERRALGVAGLIRDEIKKRGLEVISQKGPGGFSPIVVFKGDFDTQAVFEKLSKENCQIAPRGGGLRLSPHFYNDETDVKRFWGKFEKAIR
ncbi:MAG: aminotransferase class V-fold PLP-dependent enzyme [Bdellovibrionota bacterium]